MKCPAHLRVISGWGLRAAAAFVALVMSLLLSLWVTSLSYELPVVLNEAPPTGQRILDRDGRLLARKTTRGGEFAEPLSLQQVSPDLLNAFIAAEDQRFWMHPGIDLIAMTRAALQAVYHGRAVSGASTITQQLARSTFERPRTILGKWREMALALKIERDLKKEQIIEHYLNRVHFGPMIVGARAASDHYFGKPIEALDLAETATLAGLVRGPSVYDPRRRPNLTRRERDRVLMRMVSEGQLKRSEADLAMSLAIVVRPNPPLSGAKHWVRVLSAGNDSSVIHSTLDGPLQSAVEALVAERKRSLKAHHAEATAAATVVLDNRTGEVLAYVGSPDFHDHKDGGQNDGVLALRQPGSTLKPFIYAQAIDELGYDTSTLLPDEPKHFRTADGFYSPRNYDRKFRGQVSLRRALANSLNIPAVYTLEKLGANSVLEKFRQIGLNSLNEKASHYGPALALGDGEVALLDLAVAYSTLARGGRSVVPRLALDNGKAEASVESNAAPEQIFSPIATALITEVLSDDAARRESFGTVNAIELPFPVAVKTGTSKGYRDAWTVGYSRNLTVAVWVGNFDGRPMDHMTGAAAAGPLFRSVFKAAALQLGPWVTEPGAKRPLHDVSLVQRRICLEQAAASIEACPRSYLEWFASEPALGSQRSIQQEEPPVVTFPSDGMVFRFDPAVPQERQTLFLKARSSVFDETELYINGRAMALTAGKAEWELRPGSYEVYARAKGMQSRSVRFVVN